MINTAIDKVRNLGYDVDDDIFEIIKNRESVSGKDAAQVRLAYSEISAKAAELLFGDAETVEKLVNRDRSLARKVLSNIRDYAKIIESTFKGDSAAVETLKKMRQGIKLFEDALASSGEDYLRKKAVERLANQNSNRNEFNTLAMQWAFSDKTQIGERTIRYRKDSAVIIEKTENGYIEIASPKYENYKDIWSEINEHNDQIRNQSIYEDIDTFRYSGRNSSGDYGIDGRRTGESGRDGRFYRTELGRNGDGTHQQGVGNQSEIKESRRGYAGRNPLEVNEQEYNHHYWAVANDVLSEQESGMLRSLVGSINQGDYCPKTKDGTYMVAVGEKGVLNKIVFTDGGKESYSIEKVIKINLDNETDLDYERGNIYYAESIGVLSETSSTRIIEIYNGNDYAFDDFARKRSQDRRNSDVEQDGRRSGTETENRTGNEIKHSLRENATDSEGRTLSPKQIEYFKDTKVVDKNGNLLVVYHGTRNDFTVFDKSKGGESNNIADIGFWFTESKQGAQDWADNSWWGDSKTGKAMPLYLEINNPKVYESTDNNTDSLINEKGDIHRQRSKIAGKYLYDVDRVNGIKGIAEWDAFFSLAEGHDSADYYLDKVSAEKKEKILADYEQYKDLETKEEKLGEKISDLHYTSDGYQKFRTDIYKVEGQSAEDANIGGYGKALKNSSETKAKFVEMLKEQGYDGIIIHTNFDSGVFGVNNTQYVTFDSNQAKNVDNLNPTADSDIRYSLRGDGKEKVVVIDTDQSLFEGLKKSEYAEIAREYMKEKYRGQTIDGVKFTRRSENEYTFSDATQILSKQDPETYKKKMRAVTELVNFVKAGTLISHEDARHPKGFNAGGYNRYSVDFIIDKNRFSGELLVAIDGDGKGIFYDIVKIKKNGSTIGVYSEGVETVYNNNILQNSEKSTSADNISYSLREKLLFGDKKTKNELLKRIEGMQLDFYGQYFAASKNIADYFGEDTLGATLANQIVLMANDSNESNRYAYANDLAEHIIDNMAITNVDPFLLDELIRDADRVRSYRHNLRLSHIKDEIKYRYGKRASVIRK